MSKHITTAMVEGYKSSVAHLSQQSECRFRGKVREESQASETEFFEQLGATSAVRRTARHQDTPRVDSKHHRRQVKLNDYEWSDLIDKQDKLRTLADFGNPYAQSCAMALNRAEDEEIIRAATGTAYAEKPDDGAITSYTMLTDNQLSVQLGTSPAANIGLNLAKLIKAKSNLSKAEPPIGTPLYFAYTQQQLDDLLNNVDSVANKDYSSIQALESGEVNHFMGFTFIKTELLTLDAATDIRTCFAYARHALLISKSTSGDNLRITERDDKSFSTQVYGCRSIGATRMEEELVVQVSCDESP